MKRLLDLRPCDNCGGVIAPYFYLLRLSLAMIRPAAVSEFFGMHQFFGGRAPAALVENFAPSSWDAVIVAGDQKPELMTELVICSTCYLDKPIDLALLTERRNEARKAKEVRAMADEPNDGTVVDPPPASDQADGASGEGSGEGEAKPETAAE